MSASREAEISLERELVSRAQGGDGRAFGELFGLYRRPIFQLCLKKVGDRGLAEEALQETFLRAFRALPGFDGSLPFFPWLSKIALNRSIDLRQRRAVLVSTETIAIADLRAVATPDHASVVVERVRLQAAISRLPRSQRRMVVLHDVEGRSCREVAEAVGKSELAVRSSLFRARATLRAVLRTLGLAGVCIRLRTRRGFDRLSRLPAIQVGIGDALVAAAALSFFGGVPVIAATVETQGSVIIESSLADAADSPSSNGYFANGYVPSPTTPPKKPGSASPIRWRVSTDPPRSGTIAPEGSTAHLEVVSPDGQTLYYADTWIECDQVGTVPPSVPSPVSAGC